MVKRYAVLQSLVQQNTVVLQCSGLQGVTFVYKSVHRRSLPLGQFLSAHRAQT
jgi:hypothetical protein